ncbi:GAF domain-containing protein [Eisenibacter elegans]|uniref:GAF domain-containing protein n=1 Tax=Eisenibacter elegans TaxID=997 RepID=UPI000429BCE2|nr:GAF domain-containing protein [Eisenibacter elegans]
MSTSKQTYTQDAFEKLRAEFEQKEKAMQERIWLDSNVAKFDEVIRLNYSQDTQSFAKAITNYTAETTEALSAVFYHLDSATTLLKPLASYAMLIEDLPQKQVTLGQGLVGQAAETGKVIFLSKYRRKMCS